MLELLPILDILNVPEKMRLFEIIQFGLFHNTKSVKNWIFRVIK